ncbi:hypothetical protein T02_5498 [Trichinella nativa]|uniref:Uncharacterized protein n=1 Tax=Trichinella nativa TaxID=6335 RepID=A0A0V1LVH8_9BILA|nr:hypothetical protein T02_5498 [Trichinella nativa]
MKFLSSTLISQLSPHIVCWCSTIAIMPTSPLSIGEKLNEARLAQSVEHGTLNPRVVGSSPTSGVLPLMFQFVVLYRMFVYQPTASSVQDKSNSGIVHILLTLSYIVKLNDMHTTNNNIDYLCNLFIIIIIIIRISDD